MVPFKRLFVPVFALSASLVSPALAAPAHSVPRPIPGLTEPFPPDVLTLTELSSPHCDARPDGVAIDALVIHDTETPGVSEARTIVNYFQNPRSGVSAHYVIGKRGELIQCVPDAMRAWHAGPSQLDGREKVNDFSIGIELVNAQTGRDPFTDAQYRTLALLTADLVLRFNIPLTRIVGHRHVTNFPQYKRDPADNFDWGRYFTDVERVLLTREIRRVIETPKPAPSGR